MFKKVSSCLMIPICGAALSLPLQGQDDSGPISARELTDPTMGVLFICARYRDSMIVVAELPSLSSSIGSEFLTRLCTVDGDAPNPILIASDSPDTAGIHALRFIYVPHKPSETALPRADGSIVIGGRFALELSAMTPGGDDVTALLVSPDGMSWGSSERSHFIDSTGTQLDLIEITTVAPGLPALDLRLRWKKEGLTSISKGKTHSGINVSVWNGVTWQTQTVLNDAGLTMWREESVAISTYAQDTIRIHLQSLSGNVEVDAVEIGIPHEAEPEEVAMTWSIAATTDALGSGTTTKLVLQPPAGARHGTIFVRSQSAHEK